MWYISPLQSCTAHLMPYWRRVPTDTSSELVPISTTGSSWTTKTYMPRMTIGSTHWCILNCVFSSEIVMTLGLAKCWVSIVNRGKVKSTSESRLWEGQIDGIDDGHKYYQILQSFNNKDKQVSCKATLEYKNRVSCVLRSKLSHSISSGGSNLKTKIP